MNTLRVMAEAAYFAKMNEAHTKHNANDELRQHTSAREELRGEIDGQHEVTLDLETELASMEGKTGFLGSAQRKRERLGNEISETQAETKRDQEYLDVHQTASEDKVDDIKDAANHANWVTDALGEAMQRQKSRV